MVGKLRLSRNQIARFVGNDPEAIKAIEGLFTAESSNISTFQDVETQAGTADAKASDALAQLQRIADALELVAGAPVIRADNSTVTDYIDLPEIGPHATRERRVQWNADDGTVDVGLYGGSVLQVGQELHYYAKNTTGATIANGSPVIVTGTLGASGKLTIGLALGNGSVAQRYFIGAATQDIASNAFGYVTSFGLLRGFNTSAFADGDLLYVSPTVAGAWTNTPPSSPSWRQPQAIVVHAAVNGSVFMRVEPEHALSELQGVTLTSPTTGQLLAYNGTNWVNTANISPTSVANGLGAVGTPSYTFAGDTNTGMFSPGADTLALAVGGVEAARILSTGGITSANLADAVGYKGFPQNQQTTAYTLAMTDQGAQIFATSAAFTITIPANATVAFPVGTALEIFTGDAVKTLAPAVGVTLILAGTASTGSRTLGVNSLARLRKLQTNTWTVEGPGVT